MAYNARLADRIRKALAKRQALTERKMFGGITFLLRGNMCCGVLKDDLILRLGPERAQKALQRPHTRELDFTGRPMKGIIMVAPSGYETDKTLREWVQQAADFAWSLPAK